MVMSVCYKSVCCCHFIDGAATLIIDDDVFSIYGDVILIDGDGVSIYCDVVLIDGDVVPLCGAMVLLHLMLSFR
jgi:hypothetical protein